MQYAFDVRVELRQLYEKTRDVLRRENEFTIESVLLIGELDSRNAAVNLNMPVKDFAQSLGLTDDQYYKRVYAGRLVRRFPLFLALLCTGKTHVGHLAMIWPRVTDANHKVIAEFLPGKSRRELELFLSRLANDGSRLDAEEFVEVRVRLTKSQLALLKRGKEVLSTCGKVPTEGQVVAKALEVLIEEKDPLVVARRAEAKRQKARERKGVRDMDAEMASTDYAPSAKEQGEVVAPGRQDGLEVEFQTRRSAIPVAVKHEVMLRDGGQCVEILGDGRRCPERGMLEFDHVQPVCRGGGNTAENLVLKCRSHNQQAARRMLGEEFMARWVER